MQDLLTEQTAEQDVDMKSESATMTLLYLAKKETLKLVLLEDFFAIALKEEKNNVLERLEILNTSGEITIDLKVKLSDIVEKTFNASQDRIKQEDSVKNMAIVMGNFIRVENKVLASLCPVVRNSEECFFNLNKQVAIIFSKILDLEDKGSEKAFNLRKSFFDIMNSRYKEEPLADDQEPIAYKKSEEMLYLGVLLACLSSMENFENDLLDMLKMMFDLLYKSSDLPQALKEALSAFPKWRDSDDIKLLSDFDNFESCKPWFSKEVFLTNLQSAEKAEILNSLDDLIQHFVQCLTKALQEPEFFIGGSKEKNLTKFLALLKHYRDRFLDAVAGFCFYATYRKDASFSVNILLDDLVELESFELEALQDALGFQRKG